MCSSDLPKTPKPHRDKSVEHLLHFKAFLFQVPDLSLHPPLVLNLSRDSSLQLCRPLPGRSTNPGVLFLLLNGISEVVEFLFVHLVDPLEDFLFDGGLGLALAHVGARNPLLRLQSALGSLEVAEISRL